LSGLITGETGLGDDEGWNFLASGMLLTMRRDALRMPQGEASLA
jgi:hypothetical protein